KRAKEIVANVRKRFLAGRISGQDVQQLLANFGIKPDRVILYLDDWRMEFEAGRKELSASSAVKAACNGIIPLWDLENRRRNLGYPDEDVAAMIADAELCVGKLLEQQTAKTNRQIRQAQAEAYTKARRARQTLIEAQRYLASHGSPKNLHDWFCSGSIGESEVWSRLNALGWPDVDISRFLGDCKSKRKPTGKFGGTGPVVPPLVNPTPEDIAIERLP